MELGQGIPPLPIDPEHEQQTGHEHRPYLEAAVAEIGPLGIESIVGLVGCETCDEISRQQQIDAMKRILGFNVNSRRQPMTMQEQEQEISSLPTTEGR